MTVNFPTMGLRPDPLPTPIECDLKIGDRVFVNETSAYFADWRNDECLVTGLEWEYQSGNGTFVNVSIAEVENVRRGLGGCDGWQPHELTKVETSLSRPEKTDAST